MRIYRSVWLLMCVVLAVTGLLASLAVSPGVLGSVAVAGAVFGTVVRLAGRRVKEPGAHRSRAAFVLRGAALAATAAAAALGLAVAAGEEFLLVVLLVVLSSPPLVGRYYRWLDSAPRPSTAQLRAAMAAAAWASPGFVPGALGEAGASGLSGVPGGKLRLLTDEELCRRWRTSCMELPAQFSTAAPIGAIEERQELLDEIERRNPAGFWAWITSDATRSATLLKHLSDTPDGRVGVDWDTLLA